MITEHDALELLKKYKLPQGRIEHSIGVAHTAWTIATKIHFLHPQLPVNPQKVKIAGLLHDIGRCMVGDHEAHTVEILQCEGLDEIAAIAMHGSYYEIMQLRGIEDLSLKPQSLENKIVAYADATFKDRPVTLQQRWDEISKRRWGETEKIKSIERAKKRFFEIEQELEDLTQ
jgi:putative nucleotidyltransferase with HDIG domain